MSMPAPVTVNVPPVAPAWPLMAGLPMSWLSHGAGRAAGGVLTVKATPALACPFTVTITAPLVAAVGTVTVMLVALQPTGVAGVPLNVTVLVPAAVPKLVPLIVTTV